MVLCGGLLPAAHSQANYQRLKSFGYPDSSAGVPTALVEGKDGRLYGLNFGFNDGGTIFRLNKDGGDYVVLHRFIGAPADGEGPRALLRGNDGTLFGITEGGGISGVGVVFKLTPDDGSYTVLHQYGDRARPSGLVIGSDGLLYGTTEPEDNYDAGKIFKLNSDGTGYTVLRSFSASDADGAYPSGLVIRMDGTLFGTIHGDGGISAVFRLNPDGSGFQVVHHFTAQDGAFTGGERLLTSTDGVLYGTTALIDAQNGGTVFKLNPDGRGYTVLQRLAETPGLLAFGANGELYGAGHVWLGGDATCEPSNCRLDLFRLNPDGTSYSELHSWPGIRAVQLLVDSDKIVYGAAGLSLFKMSADGSGYAELHRFSFSGGDGISPQAGLVIGKDGALYGTTQSGGTNAVGAGSVFKLNSDGSGYSILHHFSADVNGGYPMASLVVGPTGKLYGTTSSGGFSNVGTVFELSPDGSGYRVLHSFRDSSGGDGAFPQTSLAQKSDGTLYGTTFGGGSSTNDAGTVFKLNPDGGGYAVLHTFERIGLDVASPSELIVGNGGVLYGTTEFGGASNAGTVFKLNTDGSGYSILHEFRPRSDAGGSYPQSGLMQGNDGTLYGTTAYGGGSDYGTVFKLKADGNGYTVLHSFVFMDGPEPQGRLVQGSDMALYGTTSSGGGGTVFKLNPDGSDYTVLHRFGILQGDGTGPQVTGLTLGGGDELYGATWQGGEMGFGTIFKLFSSPPLIAITSIEFGAGGARLNLAGGAAGGTFHIQATVSLSATYWQTIGANKFGIDGRFQFLDNGASNYLARFYRSATP
jgi:uncharacterized repeat protein (TIGR03803 family)